MTHSKAHRHAGFTLIEILIVVVILGILAAIVIPQFAESADGARDSAAATTHKTVRSQVELYKFRHEGDIPTFQDLIDNGYLTAFEQPDGYCIEIDGTSGDVSMADSPCVP